MCGICGQITADNASGDGVRRMADALRHRGPDDEGYFVSGRAALGHRRLSIIDLEGGQQPITNEDQTLWIVFNGEIYNYRDLRPPLEAAHQFKTSSDTEVILHLYETHGVDCVRFLRGMFAFAIWDTRTETLFAARDHLGQKPFYYVHEGQTFAFASEIKGLLALDPSLRQVDPEALHQYLALRIIAPPRSMFRRVRKLPPGHRLIFSGGRLTIERYWQLDYVPKDGRQEADLIDELDHLALETVRYHMVSDVPVGAFLSGGLDSSLVVAMMSRLAPQPVKSFSVGVPYEDTSELPFARIAADVAGTEHFAETINPSLVRILPDLVWHLDEPSDPLSASMFYISRMASREVKVVLGGDGGDELFGGYDRYYGNRYVDYYALLPAPLRRHLFGRLLRRLPDGAWYKSLAHKLKWMHQLSFEEGGRRYARSLSYFYFNNGFQETLFGDRLQDSLARFDPEREICRLFDSPNAEALVDRMLFADSMVRLPDHSVMILDRTTMAHGLEARAPFMDHRLVEFCARIPAALKVRGRTLRYIQVKLAGRYLPQPILQRKKQGFSSALPYLLDDEFRFLFRLFLSDSHLVRERYLNGSAISHLLEAHLSRRADHGNRLWLLCNAEIWYRLMIEGETRPRLYEKLAQAGGERLEIDAYAS